ncbi:putative Fe-S cluster assembly protein SufT [Termitidicoccus mucosus]|uniref:FeS assembly SUF system protein SufT n=1 Tax=Termitidicoccus mucosus TaxID=1184151 RepID=A0A178IKR7_9BACT|nr:FeS assembly SUF system protein SufT [Opitutaceae bacterium TSB47]
MASHKLSRDITATLIPAGDPATLPAGTEVQVMQALGGSITVRAGHGMFRIARADAGALEGYVLKEEPAAAAAPGEFSEQAVWEALKSCFDPEIPVNIVDLGLVYDLSIEKTDTGGRRVEMKMTLTAPGCGMGPVIAEDARAKIAALPGVEEAKVHIVWDPVWTPQMISDEGRQRLGLE